MSVVKMASRARLSEEYGNDSVTPDVRLEGKRARTTLSVVVPAYNEEYLVAASLARLKSLAEAPILERITVIVVDDSSSDGTAKAIARFRAELDEEPSGGKIHWVWLRHEKNLGKGAAIRTALAHVDTELVVVHDADLEYHPEDLIRMAQVFLCEDADAVFGSRFMAGGYKRALFFRHSLGNKFLTFLCDLVCDLNLTDMETCYKMVRANLLRTIPIESSTFDVEPELTVKLARRAARIFEVPINYSGRTYKEGKKITWRDGARAFWAIFRYAASDRIYLEDEWGSQVLERLNRAPRFNRWMADAIRPYLGERVLEIGAGVGKMSLHLMPRRVYWATDANPVYVDSLAKLQSGRPYMHTSYTDAATLETFPEGQTFDTLVCLNVVEHLEDDAAAMRHFYGALEHGGRAIILVPNGPGLYGSFDKLLGHYRRYTPEALVRVSEDAGFRVEHLLKFNRAGTLGWWVNACVLKRRSFGRAQIALLNLLTPIFRLADGWLPLPPLSLIAILRKDAANAGMAEGTIQTPGEARA